ncbi:MAG: MBL fold metallo-hydrolase [Candidatus Dormibacteria bacterium]
MRRHPSIGHFEEVEVAPLEGLRLIRVGGHFLGSTVLHWAGGAEGRGVLLSGDSIAVVADRRHVTFLYSYPNSIPLAAADVRLIAQRCRPLAFDRLYSGFPGAMVVSGAHAAVLRSAERYAGMLEGSWPRL